MMFIVLAMTAFISCESHVEINITCKDAATKESLEEVQVDVNAGLNGDYTKSTRQGQTDSTGYFETDLMIGCPGKCYDIYITYSKEGYKTKKDLNITSGEVFLEHL